MLMDYVVALGKWNWLILAALFFVLELIAPGAFMLWLGFSALLVGVISFFIAWSWQVQALAFAVFALASIPLWRRVARRVQHRRRRAGRGLRGPPPRSHREGHRPPPFHPAHRPRPWAGRARRLCRRRR